MNLSAYLQVVGDGYHRWIIPPVNTAKTNLQVPYNSHPQNYPVRLGNWALRKQCNLLKGTQTRIYKGT